MNRAGMLLCAALIALSLVGWSRATKSTEANFHTQWTNAQVVAAFKAAGLSIETIHAGKKEGDHPFTNIIAVQSTRFVIPAESSAAGTIFTFSNPEDLQTVYDYYIGLNKSFSAYGSWIFVKDNIVLQINRDVAETKAMQFKTALMAMSWQ